MVLSVVEYEKKVENELKDKVREKCRRILNDIKDDWISLDGVEENIALWIIKSKDGYRYVYTDLEGNILFGNTIFNYAMPFSNGCAYVRTTRSFNGIDRFILDVKNHQILTIPVRYKDWNTIKNNNLPVLDSETNKWGSYVINPETGDWSCGIPFIWDGLAFSRENYYKDSGVYVSLKKDFFPHLNIDDTSYYQMNPLIDDIEVFFNYRAARIAMTMKESYDYDCYLSMIKYESDSAFCLVEDPKIYWLREPLTWEKYRNPSTNDGTIVETGDLRDYTLKKSCLNNTGR